MSATIPTKRASISEIPEELAASPRQPILHRSDSLAGGDDVYVDENIFDSVVKLFVVSCSPNYAQPWSMLQQSHSSSSGFIIKGERILCNAHGVTWARSIRVRKHGESKKYTATIEHIGHECDLAILTISDSAFWVDTKALNFGPIPKLQRSVVVLGYPIGGDVLSITKGVVSRTSFVDYSHAGYSLLGIQTDAPINSGNSGGPVMGTDNRVVGVAFESMDASDAENVGYAIPLDVIAHFLTDIAKNSRYTGFPDLGIIASQIENAAMKKYLKLTDEAITNNLGIYIKRVLPVASTYNLIRPGDVMLRQDGINISEDGTIPFRRGERILFRWITCQKYVGETTSVTVLRDGKELVLDVPCRPTADLVPLHLYDKDVTYFICGGFVFVPLSVPFLEANYGSGWLKSSPIMLCEKALMGYRQYRDEEVVILANVLAHECSVGYHGYGLCVVNRCNGIPIRNVAHLASIIDQSTDEFWRFDVGKAAVCILDAKEARAALDGILRDHSIAADRSPNLLSIKGKPFELEPKIVDKFADDSDSCDTKAIDGGGNDIDEEQKSDPLVSQSTVVKDSESMKAVTTDDKVNDTVIDTNTDTTKGDNSQST